MAKVHLLSVVPPGSSAAAYYLGAYQRLVESQATDMFGLHTLTDDPAEADVILFAELNGEQQRFTYGLRHPLLRRYRRKCFLYTDDDRIIPVLPGIYPSIEKRWYSRRRCRGGIYLSVEENPFLVYDPALTARDFLYSFIGTDRSAAVRVHLGELRHPRGFFQDTTAEAERIGRHGTAEERRAFGQRYADLTQRSQFVLCPRGNGPSSKRLFETMRMGRAPVILADAWVPPEGPDWERCSVRVAEADYQTVPRLLETRAAEAAEIGQAARREWEKWFAPTVIFHRMTEQCLDISRQRRLPEWLASALACGQLLRSECIRDGLRSLRRRSARGQ